MKPTNDERRQLGLREPVQQRVPRNTLVIANTHGFHRRGRAARADARLEIRAYSRANPFNPSPGFDSRLLERLQHRLFDAYLRHQDRRAERTGQQPSWRLTDWGAD